HEKYGQNPGLSENDRLFYNTASALNFGSNSGGAFINDTLVNQGEGLNYGLEVTAQKTFTRHSYYLITASVYESLYRIRDGAWGSTLYNGNFVLNAVAGKEFPMGPDRKNLFGMSLKLLWAGGRRFTPLDMEASRQEGEAVPDYAQPFAQRVPHYARLDVGLRYRINYAESAFIISLDIQNLTNRLNAYTQSYNATRQELVWITQSGLIPVLNLRYEF
ncbi:MAG: TonB-dependent receptor, partial [Cytophagales bacterium]|nr:TonB-dependent receptor [Cytophagales bacterium]